MVAWLELQQMVTNPIGDGATERDADLVRRCRAREPAAYRQFVARHHRMVFAFISRALGPGAPVEDLAQEVFIKASEALVRFDPEGAARLSTWVLTIASRVVADARKRRRLKLVGPEQALAVVDPSTPEREVQRRELGTVLARAGAQLTEEHRDVFILAEFHDLSMAELGQVLGIPENTVKQRLFRARERLRELLAELREE